MTLKPLISVVTVAALLSTLLTAAAVEPVKPTVAAPLASAWTPSASMTLKESYDDNVFYQDLGPNANREAFVTTVIPAVGLEFKPSAKFSAALTYAPEINYFDSAASENFTLHRVGLLLGGKVKNTAWDVTESFMAIDGSDIGPTYLQPGGAPAGVGPVPRDRRDALIERGQFRVTQTMGKWFVRPVVAGYLHDFQTVQKTTPGYQNFVDRNDLNGGADLGWAAFTDTSLVVGYRYGVQNQAQLFPAINPIHYDSRYHRVLFGVEGKPTKWLKVNLSLGPEFRYYDAIVATGFNRDEVYCYLDGSATITATKKDTLAFTAKSFEQPGFAGRSTYLDTTLDLTWRHKLTDKLTIGAGLRAYNTDFIAPSAVRNDWILTGSGLISYAFCKAFSAEAAYVYENGDSEVPNTPAREYSRNCVTLGLKYVFK